MKGCVFKDRCDIVQRAMKTMPATSGKMRDRYCEGNHAVCARYKVAVKLGWDKVPEDLYPNQMMRLDALLGEREREGLHRPRLTA